MYGRCRTSSIRRALYGILDTLRLRTPRQRAAYAVVLHRWTRAGLFSHPVHVEGADGGLFGAEPPPSVPHLFKVSCVASMC